MKEDERRRIKKMKEDERRRIKGGDSGKCSFLLHRKHGLGLGSYV